MELEAFKELLTEEENLFLDQALEVEKKLHDCDDVWNGCLSSAFVWGDTPQGHKYWSDINMRTYKQI